MGSHNVYIKNRELDKWVKDKVKEGKFRNYSHAVEIALKLLREKEVAKPHGAF